MGYFKYEQLAHDLKNQIDAKKWLEDEKLPSIRALATQYEVSKISVQKALHTLEARGIVHAKYKSGYFVTKTKKLEKIGNEKHVNIRPTLVDVPEVFHEIMERSAAFDISPQSLDRNQVANSQLLLNRHISRALRQNPQTNALYYSEPAGSFALRSQICDHYRKRNLSILPESVCITSGCQNSLLLALMATCAAGDIVAVESPAFYGVLQLFQQLKLKVIELPSSITQGVNSKDLAAAIEKWQIKACVLTPNFATPTGASIPSANKRAIVELANKHDFVLIEDDIYGDLGFHGVAEPLKVYDKNDNVILCSSFSKSLSRDLRIGWISSSKYFEKIVHLKLVFQLSTSQALQQGLSTFLAEGHYDRHLYQYRKTLLKNKEQLADEIAKHFRFPTKFILPEGGLAIWLALPEKVDTFDLYYKALAQDVVITPGRLFSSEEKYSNCIRLSFVHSINKKRSVALQRLAKLCRKAMNK